MADVFSEELKYTEIKDHGRGSIMFVLLISEFAVFLLLLLLHIYCNRKKICGTFQQPDGTPAANQRILLERIADRGWDDIPYENSMMTVCTDREGCFCFTGLQSGTYWLSFPAVQGCDAFFVIASLTENTEDTFTVPSFLHSVAIERKGRKYHIEVTMQ